MKTIIIGGPRSGKSTMAISYGVPVFCADPKSLVKDVLPGVTYLPDSVDWENQSHYICQNWFPMQGDWVIEGVGCIRALRKWINYYDTTPPCYNIVFIRDKHPMASDLLPGQLSMRKSIDSIWNEIGHNFESITQHKYWGSFELKSEPVERIEKSNSFRIFKG